MTLSEYVKRRNGVPLGSNRSLKNMMTRSLGAGSFAMFWRYWNPIWSYYLGKYIFKPLKRFFPPSLSLIITFVVCGFIHDAVIMLFKNSFTLLFTPWFLIMGIWVVISSFIQIDYSKYDWIYRAIINLLFIFGSFIIAFQLSLP